MIRVERLVVPEEKSFCSTSRTRLPHCAHSRAMATPLMPPPMTRTSKLWSRCWIALLTYGFIRCFFTESTTLLQNIPANGCNPLDCGELRVRGHGRREREFLYDAKENTTCAWPSAPVPHWERPSRAAQWLPAPRSSPAGPGAWLRSGANRPAACGTAPDAC